MTDVIIRKTPFEIKPMPTPACPPAKIPPLEPMLKNQEPPQLELRIRDLSRIEKNCILSIHSGGYLTVDSKNLSKLLMAKELLKNALSVLEKHLQTHTS